MIFKMLLQVWLSRLIRDQNFSLTRHNILAAFVMPELSLECYFDNFQHLNIYFMLVFFMLEFMELSL